MKKVLFLSLTILASVLIGSSFSSAQMHGSMRGEMKGMKDMEMMSKCPMCKMKMEKKVVATSDGGVVILMGTTLAKYDKNLKLVNEVTLECKDGCDKKGMKMCPMMGDMKSSDDSKAEELKESVEAEKAEHESHHPENK